MWVIVDWYDEEVMVLGDPDASVPRSEFWRDGATYFLRLAVRHFLDF